MAWFKSIEDIHHKMLQKDRRLALQVDVTATPRHDNGAIFVQTVSDYPLVEAIHQNVVKHPVLPDAVSRAKLNERKSAIFTEKYDDYLRGSASKNGKRAKRNTKPLGKKAVLFVMVDNTRNCDEVGRVSRKNLPGVARRGSCHPHQKQRRNLRSRIQEEQGRVGKAHARKPTRLITWNSPHKAIVSVLMLKEGWDVRNVTTIVGLRAYAAPRANILPEQTLGRVLRRMYFGNEGVRETVSVMGTPAFMDFVESIQSEGVTLRARSDGRRLNPPRFADCGSGRRERGQRPRCARHLAPQTHSPVISASSRILRRSNPAKFPGNQLLPLKPFTPEETREIVFKTMLDAEVHHTIQLDVTGSADYRSVVAFFARQLLKDLRLVGGYDVLYPT